MINWEHLREGDRIRIIGEKRPYTVRCRNERYLICTKPFNPKHTVLYFIADLVENVRGPDDMVFCCGYETDEQCRERLQELSNGEIEVSHRNRVPLER